jgi:hypothetical protein
VALGSHERIEDLVKKLSELTWLEKCGLAFIVFGTIASAIVFGSIVSGFWDARSANQKAANDVGIFDSEICQGRWDEAYARLEPALRQKLLPADFKRKIFPDADFGMHPIGCKSRVRHSLRLSDGVWKFEFAQQLQSNNGSFIRHDLAVSTDRAGWNVTAIDE